MCLGPVNELNRSENGIHYIRALTVLDQLFVTSHFWLEEFSSLLSSTGGFSFGFDTKILSLTLAVLQDVGSESALVPDVGGILAVLLLDHALQGVVKLRPYPQCLPAIQKYKYISIII